MNIVNMRDAPYKYPSLTGDMVFRLWNAAIKDDDTLADELIQGMYHCMRAFRSRACRVRDGFNPETQSSSKGHVAGFAPGYAKISGLTRLLPT